MTELKLSFDDQLSPIFREFGSEKNQSRLVNFTLARIGRRYRAYLKANFLSGQIINGGKGAESLSGRIRVYKDKRKKNVYIVGERKKSDSSGQRINLANIFEHPGGYIILPKKKKSLLFVDSGGFWVHTKRIVGKSRPFMTLSFEGFDWEKITKEEGDSVYKKEMEKVGLA
jgi:hypothetical protein